MKIYKATIKGYFELKCFTIVRAGEDIVFGGEVENYRKIFNDSCPNISIML